MACNYIHPNLKSLFDYVVYSRKFVQKRLNAHDMAVQRQAPYKLRTKQRTTTLHNDHILAILKRKSSNSQSYQKKPCPIVIPTLILTVLAPVKPIKLT